MMRLESRAQVTQGCVGHCKGLGFVLPAPGGPCMVLIWGRGTRSCRKLGMLYAHLAGEVVSEQKYGTK